MCDIFNNHARLFLIFVSLEFLGWIIVCAVASKGTEFDLQYPHTQAVATLEQGISLLLGDIKHHCVQLINRSIVDIRFLRF